MHRRRTVASRHTVGRGDSRPDMKGGKWQKWHTYRSSCRKNRVRDDGLSYLTPEESGGAMISGGRRTAADGDPMVQSQNGE